MHPKRDTLVLVFPRIPPTAHLGDLGEELSQNADCPFASQGRLVVGFGHHQPIKGLKESFLLALPFDCNFSSAASRELNIFFRGDKI